MRSTFRRGFTTAAGVALAGVTLAMLPGSAQADDSWTSTVRIAKYTAYLASQSAQGDTQAEETAQGFAALSKADKARFLDLIEDRSVMQRFFDQAEAPSSVVGFSQQVLAGGDVVVQHESLGGADEASPHTPVALRASGYRDMWASYSVTDRVMGVKVARVTVRTNYQVKGKDTTKVYPGSATHSLSVPGCSFSHSPVKEWISSPPADNAQSETIWSASCWGSEWDKRERVWGDYRGFVGGYLKDE
ncbi:hypothetical protein ACGFX2_23370 [Streptomyces goshikiensis]|uniref:hypothetical protein n=1 Tax=Streptomyces goshikiensis TaxID=1942 RepID=UPI00371CDBE0